MNLPKQRLQYGIILIQSKAINNGITRKGWNTKKSKFSCLVSVVIISPVIVFFLGYFGTHCRTPAIVIIWLFMFTSSNFYCTYLVLWIIRIKRCIFTLKCPFNFVKLKYFNQQFNNLYLEDVSRDYTAMVNILKYSKFLVTGWGRAFQIK